MLTILFSYSTPPNYNSLSNDLKELFDNCYLNILKVKITDFLHMTSMDSWGFEPQASPMPRERSSADLRAPVASVKAVEDDKIFD